MKQTLTILLFTWSITSWAQDVNTELKETFANYFKEIEAKDNATTLEYIYPKLFDMVPKQMMQKAMDDMYSDTTMNISMTDANLNKISKILEIDGIKYALLDYSFIMLMEIFEAESVESDSFSSIDFTAEMLKIQYGEKNVSVDDITKIISINVDNEMYAIKDPNYQGWKFLEKKEGLKDLLAELLPKKALKKFK